MPGLKVIARTSPFAFKGKQEDIRGIAATLGVNTLLEGSVRRAGGRIRVIAQLISAADGSHFWSERYDRELADIFAIQDEIAQAIFSALQVQLAGIARHYTPALPAYEAYLKARHSAAAIFPSARSLSIRALPKPTAASPCPFSCPYFRGSRPHISSMPQARAAAQRALDLDPASQEAHGVLGMLAAIYDFDWPEAERWFALAMVREPVPP